MITWCVLWFNGGLATSSLWQRCVITSNGPLARYIKLWVAHAPGLPGTFFPSPRVSDPDMHHGTCVTHVPWCMPGSLNSGFFWNRLRRKRSQHSRRMCNLQFYASGKGPIETSIVVIYPYTTLTSPYIYNMCLSKGCGCLGTSKLRALIKVWFWSLSRALIFLNFWYVIINTIYYTKQP